MDIYIFDCVFDLLEIKIVTNFFAFLNGLYLSIYMFVYMYMLCVCVYLYIYILALMVSTQKNGM
jgi:hypothetical protein